MATHLLNTPQNPPKPNNTIKWYPQQANKITFWALLLSIFIYISIFYIFKLPSSTLFSTTKFWFFITNTLILIIVIDFGNFSSSRKNDHLYGEFMASCREHKASSFELQYSELAEKKFHCSSFNHNMVRDKSDVRSLITSPKDIVSTRTPLIVTKNKLDIIVRDSSKNPIDNCCVKPVLLEYASSDNYEARGEEKNSKRPIDNCPEKPLLLEYASSDNYEARDQEEKMEATMVKDYDHGQRTSLLQPNIKKNDSHVEENEFSTMSNEELNKRVEEFIRRCNRQIRLQAATLKSNRL